MKKLLSIILTVCMLFSLVIVPVSVNAEEVTYEETTLGSYYKFTFKEGEMYDYAFGAPVTYKGDTFYPLSAAGSTTSSVGYKAVTDVDTKEVYDTLEVKTGSANIVFTPVTKEGQPFEMKPGVEYTVKVNMFNPASHCWAQSYVTLGKNKALFGTSSASGGTNQLEYKNGTFVNPQTPFASGSISVQGGEGLAFSFREGTYGKATTLGSCLHPVLGKAHHATDCSKYAAYGNRKVFREIDVKYTVDTEHFEYNAETNSYSADMKAYDFVKLNAQPDDWAENYASYYVFKSWKFQLNTSETFTAGSVFKKVYKQDVAVKNYLSLCLAGGDAHANLGSPLFGTATKADVYKEDGTAIPSYDCYQIESIEVIEKVPVVTMVNYQGTTSTALYDIGETIDYPTTPVSYNDHYVWSLSKDEYSPAPLTVTGDVTVYQIKSDVHSFQNDIPTDPFLFKVAVPSVQYYNEGAVDHRSVIVRNYGVAARARAWADWPKVSGTTTPTYPNWDVATAKLHMYYDAKTDSYKYITEEMYNATNGDYDKFVEKYGLVYEIRNGTNLEQANVPICTLTTDSNSKVTKNVKFTFKYKFVKNNTERPVKVYCLLGNRSNIWGGGYKAIDGQYIILPYSSTDEWQTATLYSVIKDGYVNDKTPILALKFEDAVAKKDMSTFTILVDDVKVEDFVNTPTVIFHDGETVTEVTEGVVAGSDYVIDRVGTNAPEGLDFKGWSTTADGLNIVSTVKMPAADVACKVQLYAVYRATPKVIYHDNGAETEVTEGLVAGSDYSIDRVGAGVEGKYFAGWATTENGTSYVTKISITDIGEAKHHLYAVYIAYPDNVTYDVSGATQPTLQGYPTLTDGAITDVKLNEAGWAQKIYTENGVHFEKSLGGAYKWNPALDGTSTAHAQTSSRTDIIASTEDNPVGTQVFGGWSADSNYVLRDKNGNAIIAKPNTKYAVIVTYEKKGNGKQKLSVGMGRKVEYINKSADTYGTGYSRFSSSVYNFADEPKNFENTYVFRVTTKNFTEGDVPVISLHYSGDNLIMERIAADANGVKSYNVTNDKGVTSTYYPYKIIEAPSILIKEVKIVEIDADKVGVTFGRYNVEKDTYTFDFNEGTPGTALDVDTHNYDPKWYNSQTHIIMDTVVTTYPSANAIYYNATYGQLNPAPSTYVTGDGKKNGGTEKEWTFENALVDDKYALHIGGAKVAIAGGDAETYMTGVNVEQGHTYKVSFKYKANAAHGKFGFNFHICHGASLWLHSKGTKATMSIAAGEATNGWITKDFYFTIDLTGTNKGEGETGIDYNVARDDKKTLQMVYTQDAFEAGNDLYFADIEVVDLGEVITKGGASVLTSAAADVAGMQAMRYYFNYKTIDGDEIILGGKTLKVVERGFLYRNGKVAQGGTVASLYTGTASQKKTEGFNNCWAYDEATQMMKFSTYVIGFKKQDDTRKLEVNAYIIVELDDGSRCTIYSGSTNRSVAGVQGLGDASDSASDDNINDGQ